MTAKAPDAAPDPKASRPPGAPPENTLQGIGFVCLAVLCFILMNTQVRALRLDGMPTAEIVWARYFFHALFVMAIFPRRVPTLLVAERKGMQIVRSILVLIATVFMFIAMGEMQLADAVAISFSAPLFAVALSVVMLREKVGLRRWTAVLIGFVGMLIIIRPGVGTMQWAALLPVGTAFFYALYQAITRMIRGSADPLNALFYTAIVGAAAASLALPFYWQTPTVIEGMMLAGIGFLGGLGHWFIILAYERAEVSAVAPFAYTELIWATILGLAVFNEFPDEYTLLGAGIIVAAGLYVLYRERQASRRPALPEVTE